MKIEIFTDGPWIVCMKNDGVILNKEQAKECYEYIVTGINTTQYPDNIPKKKEKKYVPDQIDEFLKHFNVKLNRDNKLGIDEFTKEFIRTKQQVIDNNYAYYGIDSIIEPFIDEDAMIEMDNDFIYFDDNVYFYQILFDDSYVEDYLKRDILLKL